MIRLQYGKLTIEVEAADLVTMLDSEAFELLAKAIVEATKMFSVRKLMEMMKGVPPEVFIHKDFTPPSAQPETK